MSDKPTSEGSQLNGTTPPARRPALPQFRPGKDLIAYVEQGQKPRVRPAPPPERR